MNKVLLAVMVFLLVTFDGYCQKNEDTRNNSVVIDEFFLPLNFDKDSLKGFDEASKWKELHASEVELWRQRRLMALAKRGYIDRKYKLKEVYFGNMINGKPIDSVSNYIMQACNNVDFEAGNLSGWTTGESPNNNSQTMLPWTNSATGQIAVVGPGADPNVPIQQIPPGGGSFSARIGPTGASNGGYSYRLSQSFTVTPANSVFIYKYAVVLNKAPHSCTEQPFFNIRFVDCNNNPIPCGAYNVSAAGTACTSGDNTFVTSGQWAYKDWTTRAFDLSPYIGQCVTIEFTVGGCVITQGAHGGYAYVDCSCQPMGLSLNNVNIPSGTTADAICSAGNDVLCAPLGFDYLWSGPGVNGQTSQCVNVTGSGTYSVALSTPGQNCFNPGLYCNFQIYSLPTANFIADSVCLGNYTTFQDMSSGNGNPFLLFNYDWDSDGVADLTHNAISATHTFTNWGNHAVTYTVITAPPGTTLTCFSSITKNVWVHPGPQAAITNTNACIDTQPMQISGAPSTIPVGNISNFSWSYGDGTNSPVNTSALTTHIYSTPGVYVVTLTASSPNGCASTATRTVELGDLPQGSFTASKACFGKTTTLTATQSGTTAITNFGWDLNNNQANVEAMGITVNYTFATEGLQPITLMLTSNIGCKNQIPGNVYVNYNPKPNFFAPKRAGCTDLCINILDSTAAIPGPAKNVLWQWNFGNGQFMNAASGGTNNVCYKNTSNLYLKRYDVKLIVTTDSGCVDSIRKQNYITVYPKPHADFTWQGEDGDILTPVIKFTNKSQGHNYFQWYFNDAWNALDSVNNSPSHYFNTDEPKTVNVYLAIKNYYGCKDTVMKPIEIGPNFTFYIPNTFTPNGDGVNDLFTGVGIGIKKFNMWIYDRWGEMIYFTEDIKQGWDGSVKGKKVVGKTDVYQYKVIVHDIKGKDHQYVGHVTLLK